MESPARAHVVYSQVRQVSFKKATRNRLHRHSYFEPCIVISGSGYFDHGRDQFRLVAGDLFVADRGVYHEIRSDESMNLELHFLAFRVLSSPRESATSRGVAFEQESVASFLKGHRLHVPGQAHLVPLFDHVIRLVRRDPDFDDRPDYHDATRLLLRQIMGALSESVEPGQTSMTTRVNRKRIEEYIENRLHTSIRVADIAVSCAVSERTLRRRWSEWSDRTLQEEIRHRRIERAAQLLLLPDIPVAEVGYQAGIASPSQFSRQFREAKGMSPRAYRHHHLAGTGYALFGDNEEMTEFFDDA